FEKSAATTTKRPGWRRIFWLLALPCSRLHPRMMRALFARTRLVDWHFGNSYPVTAAQLLPIFTGFLARSLCSIPQLLKELARTLRVRPRDEKRFFVGDGSSSKIV